MASYLVEALLETLTRKFQHLSHLMERMVRASVHRESAIEKLFLKNNCLPANILSVPSYRPASKVGYIRKVVDNQLSKTEFFVKSS